jgi:hypothetical protein
MALNLALENDVSKQHWKGGWKRVLEEAVGQRWNRALENSMAKQRQEMPFQNRLGKQRYEMASHHQKTT